MNILKWNTQLPLFQIPLSPTCLSLGHSLSSSIQFLKHNPRLQQLSLPSLSSTAAQSTPATEETFDFEEEEEEVIVPLSNMRQWSRNKPRGFGEGRVYDTSLEDKLLEEMEQARLAQLANVTNLLLLNSNGNPIIPKHKVSEEAAAAGDGDGGIRVRLVNLPKKKNIHRDLEAAFKGFSGIINITPAVSGNHKTREPLCKGFAFVHFKSHHQATRFVDMFSTQPITFGKVQKQIRCEIMKPNPPFVDRIKSPLPVLNHGDSNPLTETPPPPPPVAVVVEDAAFDNSFGESNNVVTESLKEQKVVTEKGKKKKKTTRPKKKNVENTPKLNIPGSANRLKMKEKALLSGVFSKYGGGKSSD